MAVASLRMHAVWECTYAPASPLQSPTSSSALNHGRNASPREGWDQEAVVVDGRSMLCSWSTLGHVKCLCRGLAGGFVV